MRVSPLPYRVAVLAVLLGACAKKEVPVVELKGPCTDLYKAPVCTWAKMQGGAVLEAGATVPIAGIENSPAEEAMTWPPVAAGVALIPDSARAGTGFTELSMNWEPHGHPPVAFLTPHFDFHFYLVDAAAIDQIDCKDLSKPSALPAGYELPDVVMPPPVAKMIGVETLVGLCVPKMGMHSIPAADNASTTAFKGDMVIGWWKGKPIFIEPMLSKAMLMEKKSFDLPIPTIPGLTGNYPRKFHADWNAQTNSYSFVFSGFAPGA